MGQVPRSKALAVVSHEDGLNLSPGQEQWEPPSLALRSAFNPQLSPWRVSGVHTGRCPPSCPQT